MANLTPKQEGFCKSYIETGSASEAYRRNYDADGMKGDVINVKACELLKSGKVAVRVSELREAAVKRHEITVGDLIAELEEARQAALCAETPQSSAATSATMGKAKLLGMDKQVIDLNATIVTMTDEQRRDRIAQLAAKFRDKI